MAFSFQFHIKNFKELADWRNNHATNKPSDQFVAKVCHMLDTEHGEVRYRLWINAISQLADASSSPYEDFVASEKTLSHFGLSFLNLSVEMATWAVLSEQAGEMQHMTSKFADHTGLVAFRFLSAWILLNQDRLNDCIAECRKVDDPFGPILTLLGQALLESHQPEDAIEALEKAVDYEPREALAWFQLAKSYSLLDQTDNTWSCLEQCDRIQPDNLEIAAFMTMTAIKDPKASRIEIAWDRFTKHPQIFHSDFTAIDLLFNLAIQSRKSEHVHYLRQHIPWSELAKLDTHRPKIREYMNCLDALSQEDPKTGS